MVVSDFELRSKVLRFLSGADEDHRRFVGHDLSAPHEIRKLFHPGDAPTFETVSHLLWRLVGEGLVWIDARQSIWRWRLTAQGLAAAKSDEPNPDDAEGFLAHLRRRVPDIADVVFLYLTEAVRCYEAGCFVASTVMIGVASEAAILETAHAACGWLGDPAGAPLSATLSVAGRPFSKKLEAFQKALDPIRRDLPRELEQAIDKMIGPLSDLLRRTRNDAGHPTGSVANRDAVRIDLRVFIDYVASLAALRNHFRSARRGGAPEGAT